MEGDAPNPLANRCGSCARFVRVSERIEATGEVIRVGECLLAVWPSPLRETGTCSQYVQRGTFQASLKKAAVARARRPSVRRSSDRGSSETSSSVLTLPEDLLAMDADEFRNVLREVIQEELGLIDVEMGGRWQGGEIVMVPGKEGTQEKRVPLEAFFRKVVGLRDKLRVLEQKVNSHPRLTDEEKVQLQQYVTGCYGALTTFNVLFANRDDQFTGQKGDD